ncbi:MAG: WYL domain-containing protein [Lachnospiraceae bacterium]|nr:WYL domain-containing protein [Lachnospiraceae bacterium]
MAKSFNQKGKMIKLLQILQELTDNNHKLNTPQILKELEQYEIKAERKSIYDDIACLNDLGYDIECDKKRDGGFYMASRDIEKYELMPLVDAVSSSRFITEKKSRELIKKLESLLSVYEARELDRSVYVSNRIKSDNESIYYTLDSIHDALYRKKKISYLYCEWNVDKELVPRKNGKLYITNPLGLTWDDEKYYLIGYDDEASDIRHYRVDKMKDIEVLDDNLSDIDLIRNFDIVSYCNKTFGMYGGKEESVTLLFPSRLAGVAIDRFGKEPTFRKMQNGEYFQVRVKVCVSNQFFGWLTGLGSDVSIVSPQYVVDDYREFINQIVHKY